MKKVLVLIVLIIVVLAAWPAYGKDGLIKSDLWYFDPNRGITYLGEEKDPAKHFEWVWPEDVDTEEWSHWRHRITIKAEPQIAWIMVLKWEDGVAVWYGFDEAGRVRMKPYIEIPEKREDTPFVVGTVSINLFMWHLQGKAPIWIQHMYVEAMQRIRDKAKPFELKNP